MNQIALIQLCSTASVQKNIEQISQYVQEISKYPDVSLVVLPENLGWMGAVNDPITTVAEVEGAGPIQEAIQRLARQYGIWMIAGSIPIKTSGTRVRSSCFVYDDAGQQVARYDKIHLFDVKIPDAEQHQESLRIEPGHDVVVVDTPPGRVGLSICYDLRFPELYRKLALQGAELFTIPSAFTSVTGEAHWEVLLRARAIENLCYVLAPNQGGIHENGRHTYGHSMVVDPWGKILGEADEHPGFVIAPIELSYLKTLREQFPIHQHHILA